jgi:hypothetical protein
MSGGGAQMAQIIGFEEFDRIRESLGRIVCTSCGQVSMCSIAGLSSR